LGPSGRLGPSSWLKSSGQRTGARRLARYKAAGLSGGRIGPALRNHILIGPADIAWRVLFAFGLLPALLVLYLRRSVPEPVRLPSTPSRPVIREALFGIFRPATLRVTLVGILFGCGAHGGYYALFTWLPTFLKTERHLSVVSTGSYLGVIIV